MPGTPDNSDPANLNIPRFLADDPNHWRQRGEQMRFIAKGIADAKTKKIMLGIAESYDQLADRAALRSGNGKRPR